jgi:tetratricopeptide (TPR) repeat protein
MRLNYSFLLAITLIGCTQLDEGHVDSIKTATRDTQHTFTDSSPCAVVVTPLNADQGSQNIARYQQAILQQRQSLANLEKLGWAFVEKARSSFDPGFYKLAEQAVACIKLKQPDDANALMLQSHILQNLHRFKEAEVIARQVVAQRGWWFEYAVLGDALMEQGRLDAAAQAYQQMIDQRPGPQTYSRAAHLRWLNGDLDGAIELMVLAVRAHGARVSESAAWSQVRLAMYVFQSGQLQAAEQLIRKTLATHDNYAPALLALGRFMLAQRDQEQAVQLLIKAEQINPLPEYQWLLIEALRNNGQTQDALAVETRLMQTGVAEDQRTYALYLASAAGNVEFAGQLAQNELTIRQDVFTKDALAWSLFAAQQIPEALVMIEQALSEGTQDARLFYRSFDYSGCWSV